MKNNRMDRVSSEIQKHLAEIIKNINNGEFSNELISILKVETFADFSLSKIYISVFGSEEKKQYIASVLNKCQKTIRYELAQKVKFRTIPELKFIADEVEQKAERILKLFEQIENENKGENDDK